LFLSVAACAPSATATGGGADPAVATRLDAATAPTRRLHVVFEWNMTDREFRIGGRGVLRVDSAARARVDLFGPRGETLAAAIVESAESDPELSSSEVQGLRDELQRELERLASAEVRASRGSPEPQRRAG
jgi:hypothetical protein